MAATPSPLPEPRISWLTRQLTIREWRRSDDPYYYPTVWRKGIWAFQAHPVTVFASAGVWIDVACLALGVPAATLFDTSTFMGAGSFAAAPAFFAAFVALIEAGRWVAVLAIRPWRRGSESDAHVGIFESACLLGCLAIWGLALLHHARL